MCFYSKKGSKPRAPAIFFPRRAAARTHKAPAPIPLARSVCKKGKGKGKRKGQNHSTQDSHVVPHHGTNWAALRLTAQIGRDAVLSESYGRGYKCPLPQTITHSPPTRPKRTDRVRESIRQQAHAARKGPGPSSKACPKAKSEQKKRRSPIHKGSNKSLEQGLNLSGS